MDAERGEATTSHRTSIVSENPVVAEMTRDNDEILQGTLTHIIHRGEHVHRTTGEWSPTIHRLLGHLERVGFDAAPRFRGTDADGREILTYVEGDAATRPWPQELLADSGVAAMAALLRSYHDAVRDYRPEDARWQVFSRAMREDDIVVHGDFGPWNTIWRLGELAGIIDWDLAHPGRAIEDVAQLAWYIVPMRDNAHARLCGFEAPPDRSRRLATLCASYPGVAHHDVVATATWLMRRELEAMRDQGRRGEEPWASFLRDDQENRVETDLNWILTNGHAL
jgi:hypothetical protein